MHPCLSERFCVLNYAYGNEHNPLGKDANQLFHIYRCLYGNLRIYSYLWELYYEQYLSHGSVYMSMLMERCVNYLDHLPRHMEHGRGHKPLYLEYHSDHLLAYDIFHNSMDSCVC